MIVVTDTVSSCVQQMQSFGNGISPSIYSLSTFLSFLIKIYNFLSSKLIKAKQFLYFNANKKYLKLHFFHFIREIILEMY